MPKNTNTRRSEFPPEKPSTLTVNEILTIFTVTTIIVFAIITGNVLLLLVALAFMAFVLAGPTPSTFTKFLKTLIYLPRTKGKL